MLEFQTFYRRKIQTFSPEPILVNSDPVIQLATIYDMVVCMNQLIHFFFKITDCYNFTTHFIHSKWQRSWKTSSVVFISYFNAFTNYYDHILWDCYYLQDCSSVLTPAIHFSVINCVQYRWMYFMLTSYTSYHTSRTSLDIPVG